ncbi:hypothetical protein D3C80_1218130 [compost metagenome]
MSGWKGAEDPIAASVDNAPVTSAVWAARWARNRPASASAVEVWVPLISARPSLAARTTGVRPAFASASADAIRSPAKKASPSPIIEAAIWASGARSPEAPTEPFSGMTGMTSFASMPSISRTRSSRTPEAPRPSEISFSAMISRTTFSGRAAPMPQQCDRMRLRCSVARSAESILIEASLPKPVLMP